MIDVKCEAGGRHEWMWRVEVRSYDCKKGCGAWLQPDDEALHMLNAATQLTADEAESRVDYNIMDVHTEDKRMKEYARRWRGDTEESE